MKVLGPGLAVRILESKMAHFKPSASFSAKTPQKPEIPKTGMGRLHHIIII